MRNTCLAMLRLLAAIGIVFLFGACQRKDDTADDRQAAIKIIHTPELRAFLSGAREQFDIMNQHLADGSKVRVELGSEMAVVAALKIARGEIKPDAWLVPSISLVNLVNNTRINLGPEIGDCRNLFGSPIVLVTRRDLAARMGQDNNFDWSSHLEPAYSSTARAQGSGTGLRLTEREFSLSHCQPKASTTGLSSLTQLAFAAIQPCPAEGCELSLNSLLNPAVKSRFQSYQNFIASYPLSEGLLLSKLSSSTSAVPRIALTTEQQLVQYITQFQQDRADLVALYPSFGSYWDEYHFCVAKADWVTPAKQAALRLFADFLSTEIMQSEALRLGFRPALAPLQGNIPKVPLLEPDAATTAKKLPAAPGETVQYILEQWPELRRPAALVLVLDTSGSMEGDGLEVGKEQLRRLIAQTSGSDSIALVSFGTEPRLERDYTSKQSEVIQDLDVLRSKGGSAVYDGIKLGLEMASKPELKSHRKIIIVYTDGADRNSSSSLTSLVSLVRAKAQELDMNLIIIGVDRGDADFSDLESIASAADGVFRRSALINMNSVFDEIVRSL